MTGVGRGAGGVCSPCGAPETLFMYGDKRFGADHCIADIVRALNDAGIRTKASCCGHTVRPGNIMLADGRELMVLPNYEAARAADSLFGLCGEDETAGRDQLSYPFISLDACHELGAAWAGVVAR